MRSNWYGWQTLLVDGGWVATFLVAANTDNGGALVGLGSLDYFFGAPIVHWAHGNVGTGFASLGLRTLPFVAGGVVLATAPKSSKSNEYGDLDNLFSALIVMGLGVAAAVTIDAAVLAREEVPVVPVPDVVALGVPLYRITPTSSITRTSGTVGVSAAF